jgi:hypothetical protein
LIRRPSNDNVLPMILLLNGAFGIGKTTVARALVARLPGSRPFDPELAGIALQRASRLAGRRVDDFQDLPLWRRLTTAGLRLARLRSPTIVVPMTISNPAYLAELRAGIARFEPRLLHACLVAPVAVVHARLRERGAHPETHPWEFRRAAECCAVHGRAEFATHVDASERTPDEIAATLSAMVVAAGLPR